MFGKVMSISDDLMWRYFELLSFRPMDEVKQFKQQIADAGYDSETHRAKDEVYDNLHFCCQYDRPAKKEN